LSAGGAFAGGTLARDVSALGELANRAGLPAPLLKAIYASNQCHKDWPRRKLQQLVGDLAGTRVAVLGLTYKPGTDTLRRSMALELCQWLRSQGAVAHAYDPAIRTIPAQLNQDLRAFGSMGEALSGADAVVVATEWPEFRTISFQDLHAMRRRIVIDPNRFLNSLLADDVRVVYAAVGHFVGQR
jgi:UDPglucose 6-dehydrogenase